MGGADGIALDAMADIEIEPQQGSPNPLVAGARRDSQNRRYQGTLKQSGENNLPSLAGQQNVLYTLQRTPAVATAEVRLEIISRVCVPDSGLDPTGEVGLPALELTTDEGGWACAAGR